MKYTHVQQIERDYKCKQIILVEMLRGTKRRIPASGLNIALAQQPPV